MLTFSDKNHSVYCLRSLDESHLDRWYSELKNLSPGFTVYSRYPVLKTDLVEIISSQSKNNIWLAVHELDTDIYIGNIHIGPIDYLNSISYFGRMLFSEYRSRGIGTAMTKFIISYCFDHLNIRKVKAGAFSDNKGSMISNERAGMKLEYVEPKSTLINGQYMDSCVFAIYNPKYPNL